MQDKIEAVHQAVLDGRIEAAADGVETALVSGFQVQEILDRALIGAMDVVGQHFGQGEIFIPQVIWSAKAMQAGMDKLKPRLNRDEQASRGKIVIATAWGDIHDIGKNLVAMMLEGSGFEVVDLGVDVQPERLVDTAVEVKGDIIALSALLTTTMPAMAEVVNLLKDRGLSHIKVLIGGAPVDETFREEIGADGYGTDAMDAVRKARELLATVDH